MPGFTLTGRASAPVEEVWKLLFDPARFPDWWEGVEAVEVASPGEYTVWHDGYPGFPIPQRLRTGEQEGRVVISCGRTSPPRSLRSPGWPRPDASGRHAQRWPSMPSAASSRVPE